MKPTLLLTCIVLGPAAGAAEYYVSPSGSDQNSGTSPGGAWKTLQHAADQVGPGDTVHVLPGTYAGFYLSTSGTDAAPIRFLADGGAQGPNPAVVVNQNNGVTSDRVNLEGASYVVVEGFTILGTGNPATNRACLRSVGFEDDHARFVTFRNNRCDQGGRWGILTGFVDDVSIEGNETSRSADEHGIYVSNSGDRPVIRRNHVWGNHSNGIHMNGDASLGGDGVISGALVERNVIHGNGDGDPVFGPPGGSAINCDGVQGSVIRNNLLFDNHKSGISLYRIDGGGPSSNNIVVNNTVWNAADARWALNIQDGSTGNQVRNNILFNDHPTRGAIDISSSSLPGFVSDYNVVKDRFSIDGNFLSLAQWQAQTGQDAHSKASTPAATFAAPAAFDLQLKPGSPALDQGTAQTAPDHDLLGKPRPYGAGFDIGAYEFGSCIGSAVAYGTGLPGSGGVAPQILASGCPDAGDTFTLTITAPLDPTPGLLLLGTQSAQVPTHGGTLWLIPAIAFPLPGSATLTIVIPAEPALSGNTAYLQAAFQDAAAPHGVALGSGLAITLG